MSFGQVVGVTRDFMTVISIEEFIVYHACASLVSYGDAPSDPGLSYKSLEQ
jgi:hypothetical protein